LCKLFSAGHAPPEPTRDARLGSGWFKPPAGYRKKTPERTLL
jgi:hypothetical protein